MIQKIFNMRSKSITHLCVFIMFILILTVYVSPALAAGLTPPPATTEPWMGDLNNNPIILWINFFINWASVIIVVGSIIVIAAAGVQYSAAAGDSGKIAEAKKRISTVLMALLAYFFLFAFIQWLVPGGVF